MSTASKTKQPSTVDVYNTSVRLRSCTLPGKSPGKGGNQRVVAFKAGNNSVSKEEWGLCMKNKVFAALTKPGKVKNRVGKEKTTIVLILGKYDDEQAAEEALLEARVAEAKKKSGNSES